MRCLLLVGSGLFAKCHHLPLIGRYHRFGLLRLEFVVDVESQAKHVRAALDGRNRPFSGFLVLPTGVTDPAELETFLAPRALLVTNPNVYSCIIVVTEP